jgi:dihydroflavonol-4-reductase
MYEVDTEKPVMVTGATGYVAGWIVKDLLEAGATVHAPVRAPDNPEKVGHLQAMADESPGEIRFFKADLLDEGSYGEAMAGCGVVFHTASPFIATVDDPQRDLVDPALLGTRNVLQEANAHESVSRVVLTSSVAAIYADNADVAAAPGGVLTEEIWNETASLDYAPYQYSKTVAEREAWKLVEEQDRWDLVVINPSLVIGPGTNPRATSESFNIFRRFGDGTLRTGVPRWGMGVVDVRDLSKAHLAAAFKADAKGRHIISGYDSDLYDIGQMLKKKFGGKYPLPLGFPAPKPVVWLFGPLIDPAMDRKTISRNVNIPYRSDNSKGKRELGVTYRSLQESVEEMFQQMIDADWF